MLLLLPELGKSTSPKTLRSEEADTGGVDGVLGEFGTETVDSLSVSGIRLKLIFRGSRSKGIGFLKVPEVEVCLGGLGLIPGDFKEYEDFLGNRGGCLQLRGSISKDLLNK